MIETTRDYEARTATREVVDESLASLALQVSKAHAQTVTGTKGGRDALLRGQMPGSVSLRTAVKPAGMDLAENELGVPGHVARKMFRDMRKTGIYGADT